MSKVSYSLGATKMKTASRVFHSHSSLFRTLTSCWYLAVKHTFQNQRKPCGDGKDEINK